MLRGRRDEGATFRERPDHPQKLLVFGGVPTCHQEGADLALARQSA